ncbi:MAG: Uma2 family endonuclease [Candidatus Accumulibacter phosphatis]|uniref:Uma2 family endonuclease n=1 Tax=Candidatus Accumulibacter contiguus TaxID=2954381 RepID=A0ABX1TDE1_9PROT|nr:Uma2 family endonuclease [Candidatus Accumulibacter contiguus]NMQ07702.1 Uma2 family endonuclease [Candidatus Accumulibacter contiguus]
MGLAVRDHNYHTYADYLAWPEDVRYELIDGTAYLMAPAPTLEHQEVAGEIYFQLRQALAGKTCRVFIAPLDVRFPKTEAADERIDTVLQPDVLVVCDLSRLDHRGVCGAPDLVVEVLSPSTASHDHVWKRRVYERSGVREYWLVHPIDRMITVYRLQDGEYGKPDVMELSGETVVGILPGVAVRWDALLQRLPKREY